MVFKSRLILFCFQQLNVYCSAEGEARMIATRGKKLPRLIHAKSLDEIFAILLATL